MLEVVRFNFKNHFFLFLNQLIFFQNLIYFLFKGFLNFEFIILNFIWFFKSYLIIFIFIRKKFINYLFHLLFIQRFFIKNFVHLIYFINQIIVDSNLETHSKLMIIDFIFVIKNLQVIFIFLIKKFPNYYNCLFIIEDFVIESHFVDFNLIFHFIIQSYFVPNFKINLCELFLNLEFFILNSMYFIKIGLIIQHFFHFKLC